MENQNEIVQSFFDGVLLCMTSYRKAVSSYYRIYQCIYDVGASFQVWHHSLYSGSMYEGLPSSVCGDQDSMIVYDRFPTVVWYDTTLVDDGEIPSKNTAVVEQIEEHPAFARLKVFDKKSLENTEVVNSINEAGYINGKKLVSSLKYDDDELNGPAMTSLYNKNFPSAGEQDSVPAFRCPIWPEHARNFMNRTKPSGWPSNDLLYKIESKGCHLVAAGIPGNNYDENELVWRLSFSAAELELIHNMSQPMYTCMFAMKAILKTEWSQPETWQRKPICSYFIKTVCFWICEDVRCEELSVMELLYKILEKFIVCYRRKHLPNFFIVEHNLIGHLDDAMCTHVIKWLSRIRDDLFVVCLNSLEIDGKISDVIEEFANDNQIKLFEKDEDGEDDFTRFHAFLKTESQYIDVKSQIINMINTIKPGGEIYLFDQTYRVAEFATFNDDPIPEAFVKYKECKEILMAVPEDIILPVIERLEEVVFEGYAKVFQQSLYRYLGRMFLNLWSYLLDIGDEKRSEKSFQKAIKYSELGREMVHPDGYSDLGFVGCVQLLMCYYLRGNNWDKVDKLIEEVNPLLMKAVSNENWRNGFSDIVVPMFNHLKPTPWQLGDEELFSRLISHFYRITLLLNPVTFSFYIIARNYIRRGECTEAQKTVDDLKAFIEQDFSVTPENYAVATLQIEILDNLMKPNEQMIN